MASRRYKTFVFQIIESADFTIFYPGGHALVDLFKSLINFSFQVGYDTEISGDILYMVGGTHSFPGDQRLFFVAAAVKNKGKKNEKYYVRFFSHIY